MKRNLLVTLTALVLGCTVSLAQEGAALFKKKCAACHGADGAGKPAIKAPAIKGTSKSVDELTDHLTKGEPSSKAPHNKAISGLNAEQAKAIAEYVKTL